MNNSNDELESIDIILENKDRSKLLKRKKKNVERLSCAPILSFMKKG